MRDWADTHPKARLLQRKRDAILAAARRQFLAHGYGATSMEAIAADAGVSIMTLYRHAHRKCDLFSAVVTIACDGGHADAPGVDFSRQPLRDLLVAIGETFLENFQAPERIAVLRVVIAETARFPELGEIAHRGIVGDAVRHLAHLLGGHEQLRGTAPEEIERLSRAFVDRLLGDHALRLLLGLPIVADRSHETRAAEAAQALLLDLAHIRQTQGAIA